MSHVRELPAGISDERYLSRSAFIVAVSSLSLSISADSLSFFSSLLHFSSSAAFLPILLSSIASFLSSTDIIFPILALRSSSFLALAFSRFIFATGQAMEYTSPMVHI